MSEQIQSENNEEVAEPLEILEENLELSEENPEDAEPEAKRDFEKDTAFAQLRREKEDAQRRIAEDDKWAKENFGHQGINTMEDYKQSLAEQRKREEYEDKGIDYDEVKGLIKDELLNHPDVLKAKQIEQKTSVNSEIRALKTAYPDVDIKEIDDLKDLGSVLEKLPNWDLMRMRISKGYDLIDAYELSNKDAIISSRSAAAAQAERNKMKGKDHLKASSPGAAGEDFAIDPEVLQNFRKMFPKKIDADFIAYMKKQRKT